MIPKVETVFLLRLGYFRYCDLRQSTHTIISCRMGYPKCSGTYLAISVVRTNRFMYAPVWLQVFDMYVGRFGGVHKVFFCGRWDSFVWSASIYQVHTSPPWTRSWNTRFGMHLQPSGCRHYWLLYTKNTSHASCTPSQIWFELPTDMTRLFLKSL